MRQSSAILAAKSILFLKKKKLNTIASRKQKLKDTMLRVQEVPESMAAWALRMALVSVVPLIYGLWAKDLRAAEWMALAAECICWVELKGSYAQRLRLLFMGSLLVLLGGLAGSVTGGNLIFSIALMLLIGFASGMFRNLGDRGSGLSICVYVVFIFANARPVHGAELTARLWYLLIGCGWNMLAALLFTWFSPDTQPFRTGIARIWSSVANLCAELSYGWDGKAIFSNSRQIYTHEKAVRSELDSSLAFYEEAAPESDKREHQLRKVRKATALIAASLSILAEDLLDLRKKPIRPELRLKIYDLLAALHDLSTVMSSYTISLRREEMLLLQTRLEKLKANTELLAGDTQDDDAETAAQLASCVNAAQRILLLAGSITTRLTGLNDRAVIRSYSLVRTVLALHPRYWREQILALFRLNSLTFRYALRIGLAAAFGVGIYKFFKIDHGYWLPFTTMILLQPYWGDTFRKALDRLVGTVSGIFAGSALLFFHSGLYVKEIMLFASAFGMVYFIRRRYAVATFFITVNLALLFAVSHELEPVIIYERILCTVGGAAIALLSGYLILPNWDATWLPRHLVMSLRQNAFYFRQTCYAQGEKTEWTQLKRASEVENAKAYDSFNRYIREPGAREDLYGLYNQAITHNVRITRFLNNVHLSAADEAANQIHLPMQMAQATGKTIAACQLLFAETMESLKEIEPFREATAQPEMNPEIGIADLSPAQTVAFEKIKIELEALLQVLHKLKIGLREH